MVTILVINNASTRGIGDGCDLENKQVCREKTTFFKPGMEILLRHSYSIFSLKKN